MTSVERCPAPPSDLANRTLPIREFDLSTTDLYRIHRSEYGPIYYTRKSKGTQNRFDAADAEFGVLYVALSPEAAFIETVIRSRFVQRSLPLLVEAVELKARSVSVLSWKETRPLRVADFTQPLVALGGDALVLSSPEYDVTNQWSSAVFSHPDWVDGILYRSRFSLQECIAIFDRARLIECDTPIPLISHPDLPRILDRYGIGIGTEDDN